MTDPKPIRGVFPARTDPGVMYDGAFASPPAPVDRNAEDAEGDELVCVDECGSCDACGMEPFGTPAEGWREAARFLRRTAHQSDDRQGVLHGARLIETELRRLAAEAQQSAPAETETHVCDNCDGVDPETCLNTPKEA